MQTINIDPRVQSILSYATKLFDDNAEAVVIAAAEIAKLSIGGKSMPVSPLCVCRHTDND